MSIEQVMDPTRAFAHGVQFGRILEKLEASQPIVTNNGQPVYAVLIEMLRTACNQLGYVPSFSVFFKDGQVVEGMLTFSAIKHQSTIN